MTTSQLILTFRCLIADTFRQAMASGLMWFVLFGTALCVIFCLGVRSENDMPKTPPRPHERVEWLPATDPQVAMNPSIAGSTSVDILQGRGSLFGVISFPIARDRRDFIHFIQLIFAGLIADAGGILLVLIWTAGFIPTFLEPSAASVLLAKPAPRWCLLLGKYIGVLAFVFFQVAIFVGSTYVALAAVSGIWDDAAYLLCIPLLLIHFAVFFGFSTCIAVLTRSTIACVFGTLVFWIVCWGMNYGRHQLITLDSTAALSRAEHLFVLVPTPTPGPGLGNLPWEGMLRNTRATAASTESVGNSLTTLTEVFYWITPKPLDMLLVLNKTLDAEHYFPIVNIQKVEERGQFQPMLSILSSLLFTVLLLGFAMWYFSHTDY